MVNGVFTFGMTIFSAGIAGLVGFFGEWSMVRAALCGAVGFLSGHAMIMVLAAFAEE